MGSFQVAYKVLETDLLRQTDRERAASVALLVTSDDDARKLAGHDSFGYKMVDAVGGRAGVITFRGAEIVLLFKRKITEVAVGHADPMPQGTLVEPSDAWIRINLLDPKVPYFARTELNKLQTENQRLRLLLKAANVDLGDTKPAPVNSDLKKELSVLRTRVKNLDQSLQASQNDVMGYDKRLREMRLDYEGRLANSILEVLPSYDTVRQALESNPGDKLMLGLQGQLRSMVRNFGCETIEPNQWEVFNPELHHAIHSYPLSIGDPRIGKIVKVQSVGLRRGGMVVKAANVAVATEKAETGGSDGRQATA
jgi:molecular chaperone GrpE (heat shock protein)